MATEVPYEAIRAVVARLAQVDATRVLWSGEPEPSDGPWQFDPSVTNSEVYAGKLVLNVVAREALGTSEMRTEYDANTQTLTETIVSQRTLTISIRAECFLNLPEAIDLLERLRLRLMLRSARRDLRAAGVAFLDAVSIVSLEFVVDNRDVSAATLDIRLAQVVYESGFGNDPLDAAQWIEKASLKTPDQILDYGAEPEVNLRFERPLFGPPEIPEMGILGGGVLGGFVLG